MIDGGLELYEEYMQKSVRNNLVKSDWRLLCPNKMYYENILLWDSLLEW